MLEFLMTNKSEIAMALLALIGLAEMIVRLTPTKADDGAVERVGGAIRKALDFVGLPNKKK